jgi:quercetin dioxygenase-like cupin family protein
MAIKTTRFAAQRTGRVVHRRCHHRPAVRGTRTSACSRGERHIRAGCSHRMARPSARQTLIVTSGLGRAQRWGGPIEEIRPGDVVWFPPGEKHWHGATATTAMTHIAIQKALMGEVVNWMEQVSDEQYGA